MWGKCGALVDPSRTVGLSLWWSWGVAGSKRLTLRTLWRRASRPTLESSPPSPSRASRSVWATWPGVTGTTVPMLQLHVLGVGPCGRTQGSSEDKGETGVSAPQPFWPQPPDPPLPVAHPCRSVLSFGARCVRPIVTAGTNCRGSLSSQSPCRQAPQCHLVRGKSHGDSGAGGLGDRDVSGYQETHWGLKKSQRKSARTKPYKV